MGRRGEVKVAPWGGHGHDRGVDGERDAPDRHLTLCLTHDCNLRCDYCYGGEKSARHMTRETGRAALRRAFDGASGRLHLVFFGGEPLLRWGMLTALLDEARKRAAEAGLELRGSVTTNGTLLTPARAERLRAEGFTVAVSCDGTRRAHDAHRRDRRGRSTHARTLAGLRNALRAGVRTRVVLVLSPDTAAEIPASIDLLRGLGADDFVVNPDWGADWSDPAARDAWTAACEATADRWCAAYREGRPFWISFLDDKIAARIKGGYTAAERCDLGRRNLVVAPSGRLYPCDRLVGEDAVGGGWVLGDLAAGGPDPRRTAAFLARACVPAADCLGCALAPRCRHRCACANLAMTGVPAAPAEALCFHEQTAVRAADRAAEALWAERHPLFLRRHYGAATRSGDGRSVV